MNINLYAPVYWELGVSKYVAHQTGEQRLIHCLEIAALESFVSSTVMDASVREHNKEQQVIFAVKSLLFAERQVYIPIKSIGTLLFSSWVVYPLHESLV